MPPQDDTSQDSVQPYAERWAAESLFIGEAAEEQQTPDIHPWYQTYTPFREEQELEETYSQEAEEEDYSADLEDEEPHEEAYEPMDEVSELELYQEPLAGDDEYPVTQPAEMEHLLQEHFGSLVEQTEALLDEMASDSRHYDFANMSEAEIEAFLNQYQPVGTQLPQGFEYLLNDIQDTAKRVFKGAVNFVKKAAAYGGYTLHRGDRDDKLTYGGAVRSAAAGANVPAPGTTPFIQQLQQDLKELGFGIVGNADGKFERRTEWAVREFQIYAKMASVAAETATAARYVDRLAQTPNTQRYTGNVSGVVNAMTRFLIQHWLANRWRCPVIVEAWNMAGGAPRTVRAENIWMWDEVNDTRPRMFVRDFSNYYTFPVGRNANDLIVLGDYATLGRWSGPRSVPPQHAWSPEAELLPEHLIGTDLASLNAQQRSTYKVVRAVSEVECIGFFDSVNAYDNAFVSLGPCHWTLGIVDPRTGNVNEGELCGYLAYLRNAEPAAFRQAIEFFGIRVDEDWVETATGIANGRNLFQRGQRKYAGWVALQRDDGTFARMPTRAVNNAEDEGNYFKTWHWFYRFVMAGRTIEAFRRRMWHMARIRLRDILATQWPAGVVPDVPVVGGGVRRATIGDVYTSERAVALLLRWHIRFPAHVISGGQVGNRLVNAFRHAPIPQGAGNPTIWNDAHEARLIAGIMQEVNVIANAGFTSTMTYVRGWPASWGTNPRGYTLNPAIGALANTRNSLQFDDANLPPSPV